jgi:hypothetical protein
MGKLKTDILASEDAQASTKKQRMLSRYNPVSA